MGEGRGISERESVYRKKRRESALQTAVKRQLSFLFEVFGFSLLSMVRLQSK